eukprot:GGOE01044756.1.p1 GENE.GGOE01044756.1~~GGOE01044756.1.p1  ORF type:complete len:637 (+),score=228.55 GGOE01044756.1:161-2071(+)
MPSELLEEFNPAGEIEMQMVDTLTRVETIMANVQFLINRQGGDSKALLQREQERKKEGPVNTELRDLPKKLLEERSRMAAKELKLKEEVQRLQRGQTEEVRTLQLQLDTSTVNHGEVVRGLQADLQAAKAATAAAVRETEMLRAELTEVRQQLAKAQATAEHVQCGSGSLREQLQALAAERNALHEQIGDIAAQSAERQQELQAEVDTLRLEVDRLRQQLGEMEDSHARDLDESRVEVERQEALFNGTLQELSQVERRLGELEAEHETTVVRYKQEMQERRRLFNQVQELRGSIRVFCRVRPLLKGCDPPDAIFNPQFDDQDEGIIRLVEQRRGNEKVYQKDHRFEFDKVFTDRSTQDQVFDEVRPLVTSVMDGYNVCIFAYGQTGSGKTYTMEGTEVDGGMYRRTLEALFQLRDDRAGVWTYTIEVSIAEIYNDNAYDLLPKQQREVRSVPLDVRQTREKRVLLNAQMVAVQTTDDVLRVLERGRRNRAEGQTDLNLHSSRSHCLLTVHVEGVNVVIGEKVSGKLHLVDLAGSEKTSKSNVSGIHQTEANYINKSLSALGDVIRALANKSAHVPVRNSHLTFCLSDSLARDSKVLMIANVNPSASNVQESLSSLNFACTARQVELGRAKKQTQRL